jgi:hypothetical protein
VAEFYHQVKLMFDQYEEHGVHDLDAKQLQVPLPRQFISYFFHRISSYIQDCCPLHSLLL